MSISAFVFSCKLSAQIVIVILRDIRISFLKISYSCKVKPANSSIYISQFLNSFDSSSSSAKIVSPSFSSIYWFWIELLYKSYKFVISSSFFCRYLSWVFLVTSFNVSSWTWCFFSSVNCLDIISTFSSDLPKNENLLFSVSKMWSISIALPEPDKFILVFLPTSPKILYAIRANVITSAEIILCEEDVSSNLCSAVYENCSGVITFILYGLFCFICSFIWLKIYVLFPVPDVPYTIWILKTLSPFNL